MDETTEKNPVAPVSEPAPDPRAVAVSALLDRWVSECIHNSPVSRDTEAVNHLIINALPELLRRLLTGA
jgi:hypothetical protein